VRITPVLDHGIQFGLNKPGYERGKGVHMSQLYNAMYAVLEPKRFDKSTPMDKLKLEAGLAFEEALEEIIRERLLSQFGSGTARPDELVEPEYGIIYSPDLFIFNGVPLRDGEIKLTWMSSGDVPREPCVDGFPPKFDKWFTQMKLYCRCLETPYARLMGFFINGTYNHYRGGDPEFLVWDIEFTPRELKEEWSTVIGFSKSHGLLPR
jgi:hypothetical protein